MKSGETTIRTRKTTEIIVKEHIGERYEKKASVGKDEKKKKRKE